MFLLSRSVDEQERPFALGMQFVLLRTLGMLLSFMFKGLALSPLKDG